MKRGFLLILGSLALALVHAELPSGYRGAAQGDPIRLQYLPGAGPPEDDGGRTRPLRVGGRTRAKRPPPPNEFTGALEEEWVGGEAGVDYPTYAEVPVTSFTCEGKAAGYYADPETRCQTFHVCTSGGSTSNSFLCPNGTLFNTAVRTCDWWPAVDCGSFSDSLRLTHDIERTRERTSMKDLGSTEVRRTKTPRPNRRPSQVRRPSFQEELQQGETVSPVGSSNTKDVQQIRHTVHHSPQKYSSANRDESSFVKETLEQTKPLAEEEGYVRRPKPFRSSLRKQKQQLRVTTPVAPLGDLYDEGENLPSKSPLNPSTIRSVPLRSKFTPRPLTVTRFDFTSETLEFPSMRTTPSKSSLNRRKNFGVSEENRQTTKIPSALTTYSARNEEKQLPSQREHTDRRQYKASRLVTQAPLVTRKPFRTLPHPLRVTENHSPIASFSEGFDLTSPRKPIYFTQQIPLEVTSISPRVEHLPQSDGLLFNPLVTPEAPVREDAFRTIVVGSPDLNVGSYTTADADSFSQYNLDSSNKEFKLSTTAKETASVFSQTNAKSISEKQVTSTPAHIQPFTPTRETSPETQRTSEEHLPDVTESAHTFATTLNLEQRQNTFGSGQTNSFPLTQSAFVTTEHTTYERPSFTIDNTQSFNQQQVTSPKSSQNTLGYENTRNTQSLAPTTSTFQIPDSTVRERRPSEIENTQTPSKGTIQTSPRPKTEYNPTISSNTGSSPFTPTEAAVTHSLQLNQSNESLFTGKTQFFAQSEANSNSLLEEKKEYNPLPQSFSSAQTFSAGSFNFNNNFGPYASAFANALANPFSADRESKSPTAASPITSSSPLPIPSTLNAISPQSLTTQVTSPGPNDYQRRSRPSFSGFVNSFSSANAFVSDEGYSQPTIASSTPSVSEPTPSTGKPFNPVQAFTSTTARTTSTTPKLLYTPTVPQTTARSFATASPPKKSYSVTTASPPRTTGFVQRTTSYVSKIPSFVSKNFPNLTFSTTTTQPIAITPTTTKTPNTTKKLKGFFITHPPPTRPTSRKVPNEKEPKATYLPQLPVTPTTPTLPSTYSYQSTQPKIPDYSSNLPTTKSTYSTSSVDSVKSVEHSFHGSDFNLSPPRPVVDYRQPQHFDIYGPPLPSPPAVDDSIRLPEDKRPNGKTTTEPSFVIQKSVELFAAHEVAFHPSVFSQSSYSLSSLQDDYKTGGDSKPDLIPPPFLVPSPNARGFGRWDTENHTDKLSHPKES